MEELEFGELTTDPLLRKTEYSSRDEDRRAAEHESVSERDEVWPLLCSSEARAKCCQFRNLEVLTMTFRLRTAQGRIPAVMPGSNQQPLHTSPSCQLPCLWQTTTYVQKLAYSKAGKEGSSLQNYGQVLDSRYAPTIASSEMAARKMEYRQNEKNRGLGCTVC